MVPQIAHLVEHFFFAVILAGDNCFGTFLAHLF
jgi:hypothetical protein